MSSEALENKQSAALRRSEAYLAETQRLTRTGSFGIDVATQTVTYSSPEHSWLYGFDPAHGLPTMDDFFERIHPDDRAMCMEVMTKGISDVTDVEVEYRVLIPGSPQRIIHAFAHPVPGPSGESIEIVGTIVDVTERRVAEAEMARMAEEEAALRRVATLVARGVEPTELFAAVSREVGRMFGSDMATVGRWDPDGRVHVIVGMVKPMAGLDVGSRLSLSETTAAAQVYRTGRSARTDTPYAAVAREMKAVSGVSSPVMVEGRPWGAISVAGREPLPPDAEERLEKFTELVATAIANAEGRAEVHRLADEQTALRRVATLVAEGASPTVVFDAVAAEMERLLHTERVTVSRYEPGSEVTILAHRGRDAWNAPVGSRWNHEGENVTSAVRRTQRPARIDDYRGTTGDISRLVRKLGVTAAVGAPIVVDGGLWGIVIAIWRGDEPARHAEERLAKFAELMGMAIANADSRDQLTASRTRLLTEADQARRRLARDLHDGAQQRLVHAIIVLKLAKQAQRDGDPADGSLLDEALEHAEQANVELRELAHGILPNALARGGLRAGLEALVGRLNLPVKFDCPAERFAPEIEANAYFIVAEALTNVVKHAHATRAQVNASIENELLRLEVRDDGIGGADPGGHGMVGLRDRATALGGRMTVDSPASGGTVVVATLVLPTNRSDVVAKSSDRRTHPG